MFIGHYGAAYAMKRWRPDISVVTLFIAVQLLDVGWSILVFAGVEKVRIVPGITETNSLDLYYMPYTHSLLGALVWAVAAGAVYAAVKRGAAAAGAVVALAVFSHWVFDFVVHRPDLALYDNAAKVGLGLWNYRWPSFFVEIVLVVGGLALYLRGGRPRDRIGSIGPWLFVAVLVAVQSVVFFSTTLGSAAQAALIAITSYVAFAAIAGWLDRHRAARPIKPGPAPSVPRGSVPAAAPRP